MLLPAPSIARTVILMPSGLFSSARSQALWIIDEKTGISSPVNLYQHRSYDRLNHEHAALDALAWQWRCFHARSGLDYLFVDFGCHNDSARTCSTAMGLSGGEWSAIYDSYGRTVLYAKDGWTQADERRLRALGLLTEWYSPYPTGPTYDIYF